VLREWEGSTYPASSEINRRAYHESLHQAYRSATAVAANEDNVCLVWQDCRIQTGAGTVGDVHERLVQLFNHLSKQHQSKHDDCGRSRSKPRTHCKSSNGMEYQAKVSCGAHRTVHSLWRKIIQQVPQSWSWHSHCHSYRRGQQHAIYCAVPNREGRGATGPSSRRSSNLTSRTHAVACDSSSRS
jgi:hypothetical protein